MGSGLWQFWVDRGGTFTDIVGRAPDGRLVTRKLLSADPAHHQDAAIAGIRDILGLPRDAPFPHAMVHSVRMGTTVATNALLERTGVPLALVITRGFGDALRIGYQNRPRIFDRHIRLPRPLYTHVVEVDERMAVDGTELRPVDLQRLEADLREVLATGIRALAVVCLHSHLHPGHERQIAACARRLGFDQISCSSEVAALRKLIPRGDTTVVDAYLSPVLRHHVRSVTHRLPGVPLMFMQSHGGLVDAGHFRGKDAILSGPAGGIIAMTRVSQLLGFEQIIGFDMGGTSTDVSHFRGEYERVFDTQVAGVRLCSPMLDIHTIAAGGGSVLHFDGSRFRVGPDSAGAHPGPACYRAGGPLTVTDANVVLGRIQPDLFPAVFGPAGDQPIDVRGTRARFEELAARVLRHTGRRRTPEDVAEGFLRVAVANMANAVKRISVRKGHDVTGYVLTTFGGAGGQHACAVADHLGMRTVLVPPLTGVLSALGMGLADTVMMRQQSVEELLRPELLPALEALATRIEEEAGADLLASGTPAERVHARRQVRLRYDGSDTALTVDLGEHTVMLGEFEARHRQMFSFTTDRPLVVEAVVVEVTGRGERPDLPPVPAGRTAGGRCREPRTASMYVQGVWKRVPLLVRAELGAGERVTGPAIVSEPDATTVVEVGWTAQVTPQGHLLLTRTAGTEVARDLTGAVDPVTLEIFNNLFMSVAEQMGARLESTAQSVNIRERRDFSCALFDGEGHLIANAPHIPVHLGSMSASVRRVIRRCGDALRAGDVYAVNDPFHGGTHLPDVTVVTPVFAAPQGDGSPRGNGATPRRPLFFVASRGHHAEIGGCTPGSMPATSRSVHEEGVLLDAWPLVVDGRLRETETLDLLGSGPYPSRDPVTNLADLRAQIAANALGVGEIHKMVGHFGLDMVRRSMRHVQDNAEEAVRRVIGALRDGSCRYEMDSGAVIAIRIGVDHARREATIDFTGTSPQGEDNLNAPTAVVTAAVLYVFRTLVREDIPLNDGCLRPLRLVIPEGSMLAPTFPAAVVAGNVETSQAIVGALYAALGVQAEGSGTMNNVTFGNGRHQYYETVASGAGAGEGFPGASAVQTHMTNSRLTDPEVLESRFPVLLEEFSLRTGSGGGGRWCGGDGVRRRLRFLEPMTLSLMAGHRRVPPYGMAGGLPGARGRDVLDRADGSRLDLPGHGAVEVLPGDRLVIETPGGGGYGSPGAS